MALYMLSVEHRYHEYHKLKEDKFCKTIIDYINHDNSKLKSDLFL